MWKWRKKQQEDEVVEEAPSLEEEKKEEEKQASIATEEIPFKEEDQVGEVTEEMRSSKEDEQVSEVIEEIPFKEEDQVGEVTEEIPFEEESPYGVFIFGEKVQGGFKKFLTAIFSIFLFPPLILFGLSIITCVVLLAFPLISIALPILLLTLCILLIALPVVLPLITVLSLITGRGKVHFGLKNKKFAIKIFGITIPPHADR
jgi:hypothetical protein